MSLPAEAKSQNRIAYMTVGLGVKFRELAARSAKLFETVTGNSVRIITSRDLPFIKCGLKGSDAIWGKCFCWDFVGPNVDRVFYFDADVAAQNPFEPLPDAPFTAIKDLESTCQMAVTNLPEKLKNVKSYFNSGLWCVNRASLPVFSEAKRQFKRKGEWGIFGDQNCMNALVQEYLVAWAEFPKGFTNTPSILCGPEIPDLKLIHYAGRPWEEALSAVEMKLAERKKPVIGDGYKRVIFNYHMRLGDTIKAIAMVIEYIQRTCDFVVINPVAPNGDISGRISELLELLDIPDPVRKKIIIDRSHQTGDAPDMATWIPSMDTKRRWKEPKSLKVAYQIDGQFGADKKNPPSADADLLLAFFREAGIPLVRIGKRISLHDCVEELAGSSMFIGVDSGMAQLSYCVGTPTYIVQYGMDDFYINSWHKNKAQRIYPTIREFLRRGPPLVEEAKSRISDELRGSLYA
jgi:hypothetical protein